MERKTDREGTREPRRDGVRYLARLFSSHLPGQRRLVTLAALMLALEAATAVFQAYPLAYLIDYLKGDRAGIDWFGTSRLATVAVLCVLIVILAALNSLFDSIAEIFLAKGGRLLGFNLRTALFGKLQRLSLAYHDRRKTGDVLARVTGDVDALEDFVIKSFSDIVGSLLLLVFTLVFLGFRSWVMLVVAITIVPVVSFVSQYFSVRIRSTTKKLRQLDGQVATSAQEMLSSVRVIQTYGMAGHELKRFEDHNHARVKAAMRAAFLQAEFSWVVKVLEALVICVVVVIGLELVDNGTLTVGLLVMMIMLIENMFKPTRKLIKEWGTIGKVLACSERVGELLDRPATVIDRPGARPAPPLSGELAFDDVTFTYLSDDADLSEEESARPAALSEVSFHIRPGQAIAIVGHTGAGKSTVLQLLLRLYDTQEGRVLLDGHDVRDLTIKSVRDQFSVVLQETVLFGGTVMENIAYGRLDATLEEVIEAARSANAHEFIERLPDGYHTMLGERGANLSGGQRQRIAIARAFIRDTPILLLDEPTTGLDAESASLVLQALRTLMKGKTTVIVSHDLRLIRRSHQIIVMNRGRIEQSGDHDALIAAGGTYARLQSHQIEIGGPESDVIESPPELGSLSLDLGFDRALPALAHAFDGAAMAERLAAELLDDDRWVIVECEPGKAASTPDGGCTLRYALTLRAAGADPEDAEEIEATVLARVFAEPDDARIAHDEEYEPLATAAAAHPLLRPFDRPVALLADLAMVLSVFPVDPALPSLAEVTDPAKMTKVLAKPMRAKGLRIVSLAVAPGHYGRRHRCVIRYDVEVRPIRGGQATVRTLWGKVAVNDVGGRTSAALGALNARSDLGSIRVPSVVVHRSDLKLVVLDSLAGEPVLGTVLKAEAAGRTEELAGAYPASDEMVERAAAVAAVLHTTDAPITEVTTTAELERSLRGQLESLAPLAPGLGEWLAAALDTAVGVLSESGAGEPALSHGDFTYTQLLFAGASPGLIDFDTVTLGEPAIDLGHFTAYLRLSWAKASRGAQPERADELVAAFLAGYREHLVGDADPVIDRVAGYELLSLVRSAIHSWLKLKADRLALTAPLIRRSVELLSGTDPGLPEGTLREVR